MESSPPHPPFLQTMSLFFISRFSSDRGLDSDMYLYLLQFFIINFINLLSIILILLFILKCTFIFSVIAPEELFLCWFISVLLVMKGYNTIIYIKFQ